MRSRIIYTIVGMLLIAGVSCKRTAVSETQWGHLFDAKQGLIAVPPNGTIKVCVESKTGSYDYGELTKRGVLAWAATIGRDKALNVVTMNQCAKNETRTEGAVYIQVDPTANNCHLAIAYERRFGKGTQASSLINICEESWTSGEAYAVILHELGHAWGLCDQYIESDTWGYRRGHFNSNCTKENRSATAGTGVMAGGGWLWSDRSPRSDDIEGMRALAARADIPANALWRERGASTSSPIGVNDPQGIDHRAVEKACLATFENAPEKIGQFQFFEGTKSLSIKRSYAPGENFGIQTYFNQSLSPTEIAIGWGVVMDAKGASVMKESGYFTKSSRQGNIELQGIIPSSTAPSEWNAYMCRYVLDQGRPTRVESIRWNFSVGR
jgi:hypothetical protein